MTMFLIYSDRSEEFVFTKDLTAYANEWIEDHPDYVLRDIYKEERFLERGDIDLGPAEPGVNWTDYGYESAILEIVMLNDNGIKFAIDYNANFSKFAILAECLILKFYHVSPHDLKQDKETGEMVLNKQICATEDEAWEKLRAFQREKPIQEK